MMVTGDLNDLTETTLRDGTRVIVRRIQPDDRAQYVEGFEKLSMRSRYLRFHTAIERLTEQQLDYLTEVDQVHHVAWVALDHDQPDHPGIGIARFVRLDDEPNVAEAAITVLDDYQGRGLGSLLLDVIARVAREQGIDTFRAYVLDENRAMLAMLERLGPTHTELQAGVYQIDVDLDPDGHDQKPSTERRVFRAVTGKQLPRMRTTVPPVWASDGADGDDDRTGLQDQLDKLIVRRRRHDRDRQS